MAETRLIEPVFENTDAAVCIVASEMYAPFAAVVVASIVGHARADRRYDIVLLSSDMTAETQARLKGMGRENVSVRIVDVMPYVRGLDFYVCSGVSANTYYRLLAPDIFSGYDRIVYLDSDVVVNRDIADLFGLPLGENYMAAAPDSRAVAFCTRPEPIPAEVAHIREELGLEDPTRYYQGGVALYNLAALRKDFPGGRLVREATTRQYRYMDQDLTNVLFRGRILELPSNWNVMVSDHEGRLFELDMPEPMRGRYLAAREDPWIVHYITRMMPCCAVLSDFGGLFWTYARQTPFYRRLVKEMLSVETKDRLDMLHRQLIGILHE